MSRETVEQFFDALTDDYTSTIERCFPRYREMLWALLDYLPPKRSPSAILELGCGTGNLSELLANRFPNATLRLVDLSGESIDECRRRLSGRQQIEFEQNDFRQLDYDGSSFDLVISNISIHHLNSNDKQELFHAIHRWLRTGGIFTYADQFAGATDELYVRHMENWKELSFSAGATQAEWDMWMQHQNEHDHHDTLADQFDWLKTAGFSRVDCPWRYLLWSVVQSIKD
jgi:tRNA (cmo5U34)-methyltransferase